MTDNNLSNIDHKTKFNNNDIKKILDESEYKVTKQTNSGNFIEIKFDDKFKLYDLSNYYKNGILKMNLKNKLEKYNNLIFFISDSTELNGIKIGNNNFLKNKMNCINNSNYNYRNVRNKINILWLFIYILIILFIIYKVKINLKKIL